MNEMVKSEPKNEIVVYQPNETVRLEVRVENDTVWLTQAQLCELFGVVKSNVSYHLKNIFSSGELSRLATVQEIRTVQNEGGRRVVRMVDVYNLDAIISLGFRINSKRGIEFRQWATVVIKNHMLQGVSVNQRMIAMEDRIGRRLSKHDADIVELRKDVDFFISSSLPPKEKVFVEGKMLDAQVELTRIVKTAKSRIVLDNTVWHIGASLKDAGSALFAMMKMELDPTVILGLLP